MRHATPRLRLLGTFALRIIALALAGLVLAASIWWDNAANRGIDGVVDRQAIAWADVPRGGVNTYGLHQEVVTAAERASGDNKVARTFRLIREAGFHFVRVQFPWEDIEVCGRGDFRDCRAGSAGTATWIKYDYIVAQARENGLELIVRLDRPPAWARAAALASPEVGAAAAQGRPVTGPPDRLEDYAEFVAAVAARYRDDLRFYQIWNEPNLPEEWNYRRQDPAEFVRLLRLAGDAVRRADPDAVILFPALSPTDGLDETAVNDLEYLQGVYDAGGRDAFDIMSAQLYGLGQPPDEHRYVKPGSRLLHPIETRTDVSRVVLQREIMVSNGDAGKAVWISEMGWNSAPMPHPWGSSVSEEEKGRYLVAAMQRAEREWPWMGVMCVWMFRWGGEPPNPADPTPYFQLVDFDFAPLPAYERVAAYLESSQPSPPARRTIMPVLANLAAVAATVAAAAWLWPLVMAAATGAASRGRRALRRTGRVVARPLPGSAARARAWLRRELPAALMLVAGLVIFYRASAQLPLTLLGALIFIPAALLRPDLALLAVPATAPLYLAPKGIWDARFGLSRPEGYFLPLHELVLLASLAGSLLCWRQVWSWVRDTLRRPGEYAPMLLFFVAGTLGVLVAGAAGSGPALREWRWLIVEPLIFYALVRLHGEAAPFRTRLLWSWLLTGVAVAAIGILQLPGVNLALVISRQSCFSDEVVSAEGVRRATSVYCHPNNLGLALGRVWPVLVALQLGRARRDEPKIPGPAAGSTRRIAPPALRRMAGLPACLAAVVLLGIAASFSKGALLGALAALVTLGLLLRERLLLWLAAAAVVLGVAGALLLGVERLNPLGGSSGARVELWGSAAAMLRDHPLLGIGLDQFIRYRDPDTNSPYISPEAAATSERYASHPHNALLDILLRIGPFGLVVMLWLLARFFSRAWSRQRSGDRVWEAGLLAAMVAALVHGLVDNFYFVPDLAIVFWLHMALVDLRYSGPRNEERQDQDG